MLRMNTEENNPEAPSDVGGAPLASKLEETRISAVKGSEIKRENKKTNKNSHENETPATSCDERFSRSEEESGFKSLFKLFSNDISMAVPLNTGKIPVATESVKGPRNRAVNRTPANYYSSLRLYRLRLPGDEANNIAAQDHHKVWIPTPLFQIGNSNVRCYPMPSPTPYGDQLLRILNTDLANTTSSRAFVQITRVTDQQSLVSLIALAQQRPADFNDEALLVRCLLLWQTLAVENDYKAIRERAVTEVAINCRTGPVTATWAGGAPPAENTATRPGTANGESNISITTLTEYTILQSRNLQGRLQMLEPDVSLCDKAGPAETG